MAEKKTTHRKADEGYDWTKLLLDGVLSSFQAFVNGTLTSVQEATQVFTQKLMQQAFLFFFALFGFILVFLGLANVLSALYRFPGVGEMIVGLLILSATLVLFAFNRKG